VDLSTIARLLGHAHLNTTNKYILLGVEDKRQALIKSKPLLKHGGKAAAWRQKPNVLTWLENL
jgi:integrase